MMFKSVGFPTCPHRLKAVLRTVAASQPLRLLARLARWRVVAGEFPERPFGARLEVPRHPSMAHANPQLRAFDFIDSLPIPRVLSVIRCINVHPRGPVRPGRNM